MDSFFFYLNYLLQPSTVVNIVTVNRALTFYMDSTYSSLTILWTTIVLVMWGAAELWLIGAIANVVWYDMIWYDVTAVIYTCSIFSVDFRIYILDLSQ